jgi:hypothetical protein
LVRGKGMSTLQAGLEITNCGNSLFWLFFSWSFIFTCGILCPHLLERT